MNTAFFVGPALLKADVKPKDLEKFYVNEFVPNIKPLSGYKMTLNKGDHGARANQYLLLGHFENQQRARELFPDDEANPDGSQEFRDWVAENPVWNQLLEFFDYSHTLGNFTEYIEVS